MCMQKMVIKSIKRYNSIFCHGIQSGFRNSQLFFTILIFCWIKQSAILTLHSYKALSYGPFSKLFNVKFDSRWWIFLDLEMYTFGTKNLCTCKKRLLSWFKVISCLHIQLWFRRRMQFWFSKTVLNFNFKRALRPRLVKVYDPLFKLLNV